MQASVHDLIRSTFEASSTGQVHFRQVIERLTNAQVESHVVDCRCGRITCYWPGGETMDLSVENLGFEKAHGDIAEAFDGDAIRAAILGAQQGRVMYPEFKQRSRQAGRSGCTVWIAGRHVTYVGRKGETHVEHFPGAAPAAHPGRHREPPRQP